eukprot:TRINITY_DN1542_c0_g1_i6.p1 TRINITY_DN1542_c0_g1~~TRINITY_DN1542_c0_g1_i6.p1  ORF type:complete len:252 (-),score=24.59 TRINITY_DN1542_c0_g1_i6:228-983(-)
MITNTKLLHTFRTASFGVVHKQRCCSVMASAEPTIYYFPGFRGRAESIKLALSAAKVPFVVKEVGKDEVKPNRDLFPFAQVPAYVDQDIQLSQSNAIVRYLGNKYNMMGKNMTEAAKIDQILEGVESMRQKHRDLVYVDKVSDEAKSKFIETHVNPDTHQGRNGGAHFFYLKELLMKNQDGRGFVVGDSLSVGDIQLFEVVDILLRIFDKEIRETYPELVAHHERIAAIPEIKSYLEGPQRLEQANNYGLG